MNSIPHPDPRPIRWHRPPRHRVSHAFRLPERVHVGQLLVTVCGRDVSIGSRPFEFNLPPDSSRCAFCDRGIFYGAHPKVGTALKGEGS